MRRLLPFALFVISAAVAQAQLTYEQVRPLFQHLQNGEHQSAWALSDSLIETAMADGDDADDMPLIGIVRYSRLYSGAHLVAESELTYDDLRPAAKKLEGSFILMPGHPTRVDSTGEEHLAFNMNTISVQGDSIVVSTTTSNEEGTVIYSFEYVHLADDIEVAELDGLDTRCGGTLARVEFNPNESLIWIMRIIVEEGRIQEM